MSDPTLRCPHCKTEIKLTESLAAPLIQATRREFEKKLSDKDAEIAKRETALVTERTALAAAQAALEDHVAERVNAARAAIAAEESKKARRLLDTDFQAQARELEELQALLNDRDTKLGEAQRLQAETIRKQRELDDERRALELTVEQRVQAALADARKLAKQEAEEGLKVQLREREVQIGSMQRQIEELRRKAEQGSQQLQGEAMEVELEDRLRSKFPADNIDPVPKGEFGGDLIHRVIGGSSQECGTILWEVKRTKHWADNWLVKLREDQRAARAEVAVLVSRTVPKGLDCFDLIDGVWVVEAKHAIPVAIALRQSLIELSKARAAADGQQTKKELVYKYLTGPRFRHRIEAMVEKVSELQDDLERERKTMIRQWAKREEQIRTIIESTVGMYGDLQGIAGRSLLDIQGLEMPLLDAPAE